MVEMPAALSSSNMETGMALLIVLGPQCPFEANTAAKSFSGRSPEHGTAARGGLEYQARGTRGRYLAGRSAHPLDEGRGSGCSSEDVREGQTKLTL